MLKGSLVIKYLPPRKMSLWKKCLQNWVSLISRVPCDSTHSNFVSARYLWFFIRNPMVVSYLHADLHVQVHNLPKLIFMKSAFLFSQFCCLISDAVTGSDLRPLIYLCQNSSVARLVCVEQGEAFVQGSNATSAEVLHFANPKGSSLKSLSDFPESPLFISAWAHLHEMLNRQ